MWKENFKLIFTSSHPQLKDGLSINCRCLAEAILVPRIHFSFGQRQEHEIGPQPKPLTTIIFILISENAQKSRKSVICGLLALAVARVRGLGADQKKIGIWQKLKMYLNEQRMCSLNILVYNFLWKAQLNKVQVPDLGRRYYWFLGMLLNLRRNLRLCLQFEKSSFRLLSVAMSGLHKIENFSALHR